MERAGRHRSRPHARSSRHRQDGAKARTQVRGHRHIRGIHRNRARKAEFAWIRAARSGGRKSMPANRIGNSDWVVCRGDGGFAIADGEPEPMMSRFPQNSLGGVDDVIRNSVQVFLPGQTAAALAGRQNMVGHNRMAARHSSTHPSPWATTRRRGRIKPASACSRRRRRLGRADINARGCRSPESRGMRGAQTAFPALWIPAFAGMTGESTGMTGVECGNDRGRVRE